MPNQVFNQDSDNSTYGSQNFDEDGRIKRTGNTWTVSAHIITAVIGSGVLSLAWAIAQLGWIIGPIVMMLFSLVTLYTSGLLTLAYRTGNPETGKRNYTYREAVRNILGGYKYKFCGFIQYINLCGAAISYTIAAALSMMTVQKSHCIHSSAHKTNNPCKVNGNYHMIVFGVVQILLSQIPDFDQLWWLSTVAAVMSFTYSTIGLLLGVVKVIENGKFKGNLNGSNLGLHVMQQQNMWNIFQSLGNIAFAYSFSLVLVEIQDTIRNPPAESKTMKKAAKISIMVTTIFYMLCGCFGYGAFGSNSPGNLLTGFGSFNPYWVVDIANMAIIIHLVGAYQVFTQPLYSVVELKAAQTFPTSKFISREIKVPIPGMAKPYNLNLFRFVWRTFFVVIITLISMVLPFFNNVVGLLGALGFWPLTVFFPIEMYIVQRNIPRWSFKWVALQTLSVGCFLLTVGAAAGSIVSMVGNLKSVKIFGTSL